MSFKRALGLVTAASLACSPEANAQTQVLITPEQLLSAGQDCADAFEKMKLSKSVLQKRGWKSVKLGSMGGLESIMTGWVRNDGILMFTMQTGCIIKVRTTPDNRMNTAVFDEALGPASEKEDGSGRIWKTQEFEFDFTPGPEDGSNVNLSVRWIFPWIIQTTARPVHKQIRTSNSCLSS